jgi:hypothetical protein
VKALERWLYVMVASAAGCAVPHDAAPIVVVPAASSSASADAPAPRAPRADAPRTRAYVGFRSGLAHLVPAGLELQTVIDAAAGPGSEVHLLVTRRGPDLVVLLLDDHGVVVDSMAEAGAAAGRQLVPGCSAGAEDVHLALVPKACSGPVVAARGWSARGGKLEAVGGEVKCVCTTF